VELFKRDWAKLEIKTKYKINLFLK
jgi:hypothetical protein